ncbi:MAG: tetratricopeptide repeat protein [Candidatus Omnitrophota bacterium]
MRKIPLTILLCAFAVTRAYANAGNPVDAKACLLRGIAYERCGRIADAIGAYKEAIEMNPGFHSAHQALGIALAMDGRQAEAIAEFEKAKRLDPNNWVALSDEDIKDDPFLIKPYDSAIEVCRQEISSNPAEIRAKICLARNYMTAERRIEK